MHIYILDECGGTVILTRNSTLSISGIASFLRNQAAAPGQSTAGCFGGALAARYQSNLTFEKSSFTTFLENSASYEGGAVHISGSNLMMHGMALFESNTASDGEGAQGGAVAIRNPLAVINGNGTSITFRNNTSSGYGGAINTEDCYYDLGYNQCIVELRDILFEGNTAKLGGGAIMALSATINLIGTIHFFPKFSSAGRSNEF